MSDRILCALAGYDAATENQLAIIQENLYAKGFVGEHTKDLPQHITLATFPASEETRVVALAEQAAKESAAFEITFNHIGIFGGSRVLFVAPDTNRQLLDLQARFAPSDNWTAHTTMLIDEPELIHLALPIVAGQFRAFRGRVETLYIYEFWPSRLIAKYALQK